jgi:hypothetical protein
MNHLQKAKEAARRIEDRTDIEDAYDLVDRAEKRAREHLAFELDDLLSDAWIEDAAILIAHGAAFEQMQYIDEYSNDDSVFVDSRSYREAHRRIGLGAVENILDLSLYEEVIIPECDAALRIASRAIKDGVMQPA